MLVSDVGFGRRTAHLPAVDRIVVESSLSVKGADHAL